MYPPAFEYQAPDTLEGALAALAELGDEGRVLAGGQSLIPMMKLRLAAPSHLVDINRISELSYVRRENGSLCIGALARHNDVVGSADAKASGVVSSAAPWISDPLVRNRGTVCGSVAHCDPEGDWNSVMLAARASRSSPRVRRAAGASGSTTSSSASSPTPWNRARWSPRCACRSPRAPPAGPT